MEKIRSFIELTLREDIQEGDHTTLACVPPNALGKARLLVKDKGIIAGIDLAKDILKAVDQELEIQTNVSDGDPVIFGDTAFIVSGKSQSILSAERLLLNFMQRMSGIATLTHKYVSEVNHTSAKILDTRKTSPGLRFFEKWAVRLGGGFNHRMGLYDMIMIKDNHIDFCGGIEKSIDTVVQYLIDNQLDLKIEIETRNLDEVKQVLKRGSVDRIMLDNFELDELQEAVKLIGDDYETEASGGVNLNTVKAIAETGVDFISVGALTHSVNSLDLSLKAI